MRGSPPFQALILMVTLFLLGCLGSSFIKVKSSLPHDKKITQASSNADVDQTEAEVELTFSSPPISYELKRYTDSSSTEVSVLGSAAEVETLAITMW